MLEDTQARLYELILSQLPIDDMETARSLLDSIWREVEKQLIVTRLEGFQAGCAQDADWVEDRSEIARHHRDFATIRTILDEAEQRSSSMDVNDAALRRIRNIVG